MTVCSCFSLNLTDFCKGYHTERGFRLQSYSHIPETKLHWLQWDRIRLLGSNPIQRSSINAIPVLSQGTIHFLILRWPPWPPFLPQARIGSLQHNPIFDWNRHANMGAVWLQFWDTCGTVQGKEKCTPLPWEELQQSQCFYWDVHHLRRWGKYEQNGVG